jgi:DNA repair photolyase
VLAETRHPLAIITKSALVLRDIDLLAPMAAQNLAMVNISLTTLDPELARAMEPRAAAPYRRLQTMEILAKAGIPVRVMAAPMIPGLNDMELERILQAARDAGAYDASYTLVRLPWELKTLFEEWLRTHRPNRADRVLSLIRQTHDGKLYNSEFGKRRSGEGPYAELLHRRFAIARKRYGMDNERELRVDLFRAPPRDDRQFTLGFD